MNSEYVVRSQIWSIGMMVRLGMECWGGTNPERVKKITSSKQQSWVLKSRASNPRLGYWLSMQQRVRLGRCITRKASENSSLGFKVEVVSKK